MSITFPGAEGLLRQEVLARLDEAGKEGMEAGQFRRKVDASREEVARALERLQAEGKAVEMDGRWFSPRHTGWTVGIVQQLEEGDALIRPGPRQDPVFFVRRRNLKRALDGDTVVVRRLGKGRPWDDRPPEGTVVKVLGNRFDTLTGTLETDDRGIRWLAPFDPKLSLELPVDGAEEVPDGHYVVVAVDRPAPGRPPRGRVVEVLGDPEEPGVDVLVVLRHYGIPEDFPDAVLDAAAAFPPDPRPQDWAGREDLRDRVVVTIDGESARDFDDAVSIERLPGGAWRLGVHIADVAHYVKEGEALDLEAYRRGTSVYYPERAIPMLPEGLSNGLCSLRPGVPRLTVSVFLDIDRRGRVHHSRFAETVIRSARRLTYAEVRRVLEEPREEDAAEYGPALPVLREMGELMKVLNRERMARGSIDFDLPEGDVILNTDGVMVGVFPEERNVAHRLIEEFMIAANEAVAFELVSHSVAGLFRVHAPPSPERLEELQELLATFGLRLRGDLDDLPPGALQEVTRQVQGRPEEHFISSVVLRTLQRAVYDPHCLGHYALASEYYCHFTSPIRRYPDLVVHRQLKALLHGRAERQTERSRLAERLPVMAEHTSQTERRAEQSERDLLQWKKVRFLAGRAGETFGGRITGVQPFGLFVQLDSYYVDGLVPIRTMADDYYRYEPEAHRLVGERMRRVFRLADPVEVVLVGASPKVRGLDFKLAGMPEPGERMEGPWRQEERRERRARRRR
ncbi:MAG TPA: ribonuclease R [Thermoanaerobaculia bacterium]|jgi:ribonuclease R